MMVSRRVRVSLSIGVAIACATWSALIFAGSVLGTLPTLYRSLFGAITLLYGVYRLVLGFVRRDEE